MIAYMEKNKDWCQIPDEALDQLKANHAKSVAFSAKACKVAAQMKKMKEQAGAGRRPAGPAAAGRPALSAEAARPGALPDARPDQPRAAADAGFCAALRATRAARPAGRLAVAARALLVSRRRWPASPSHRGPEPLASRCCSSIGAIAMRGAGCTYNDILDRNLDAGVERTKGRPLPSGRVSVARRRAVPRRAGAGRPRRAPLLQSLLDRARPRLADRSSPSIR